MAGHFSPHEHHGCLRRDPCEWVPPLLRSAAAVGDGSGETSGSSGVFLFTLQRLCEVIPIPSRWEGIDAKIDTKSMGEETPRCVLIRVRIEQHRC